jgi:hypothetical protein
MLLVMRVFMLRADAWHGCYIITRAYCVYVLRSAYDGNTSTAVCVYNNMLIIRVLVAILLNVTYADVYVLICDSLRARA